MYPGDLHPVLTSLLDAGSNVRRGASGALALAYVADGRSDGYAELHMNSWDCLAGLLLVREAGGVTGGLPGSGGLRHGAAVLAATPAVAPYPVPRHGDTHPGGCGSPGIDLIT